MVDKIFMQYYLINLEPDLSFNEIDIFIEDITCLFKGTFEECNKYFIETSLIIDGECLPSKDIGRVKIRKQKMLDIQIVNKTVTILFNNNHPKSRYVQMFVYDFDYDLNIASLLFPVEWIIVRTYKTVIKSCYLIENKNLLADENYPEDKSDYNKYIIENIHSEPKVVVKSAIQGIGYGSCHIWELVNTRNLEYYNPTSLKMSKYVCLECEVEFCHYYAKTPDIFDAMEKCDIPRSCFTIAEKNKLEEEFNSAFTKIFNNHK